VAHPPHSHETPSATALLRSRGRRLTKQRRQIWDVLVAEPDAHLSADDVVELVRRDMPGIDASTVYRTLDLLVREGLVHRTDLGAGHAFFEPAREHLHHHVVCTRCGSVTHVHDDELGDVRERLERTTGYELAADELVFFGLCSTCRGGTTTP
jgi:Fur family ferric uptake transcriptional regulator